MCIPLKFHDNQCDSACFVFFVVYWDFYFFLPCTDKIVFCNLPQCIYCGRKLDQSSADIGRTCKFHKERINQQSNSATYPIHACFCFWLWHVLNWIFLLIFKFYMWDWKSVRLSLCSEICKIGEILHIM